MSAANDSRDGGGRVRVVNNVTDTGTRHATQLYELVADKADKFSEKIFTGDTATSQVCKLMREGTGQFDSGCEEAAAFTSWSISVPTGWALYGADGVKAPGPGAVTPIIQTTLPSHKPKGAVPPTDSLDIKRFLTTLAIHERGHGSMGDQVVRSFRALCDALPPRIAPGLVPSMNQAVHRYLTQVLEPGARHADVQYDLYTGHGLTQGAQSGALDQEDAVDSFLKATTRSGGTAREARAAVATARGLGGRRTCAAAAAAVRVLTRDPGAAELPDLPDLPDLSVHGWDDA
jgi:hypothetical protein